MMSLQPIQIVIMSIGTALLAVWIVFFVRGRQDAHLFAGLEEKEYPLKDLYGLGYALLTATKYSFRTRSDVQLRQFLEVLFTRQYSEFYMRAIRSQQVTIALTLAIVSFGFYGFSNSPMLLLLMLVASGLAAYYFHDQVKTRVRRRS